MSNECKYCAGIGYHYAGDGMVYECVQCDSTGKSKVLSDESMKQIQKELKSPAMPTFELSSLMKRNKNKD